MPRKDQNPSSSEQLKVVPQGRWEREQIRRRAFELVSQGDRTRPVVRPWLEARGREILGELRLPESYLGWAMVAVASAYWREQVEAVPFHRRLLLLPHCLRNSATCPADYDRQGLACQDCGACRLSDFRALAKQKGYQVLIAEGSPAVIDIILRGQADAILGAACLDSLEKALSKIVLSGIPCMAVPLLHNSCRDTATDEDWVREMIDTPYRPKSSPAPSYMHLLRLARQMFEPDEIDRLLPKRGVLGASGNEVAMSHPAALTDTLAREFLGRGGKHLRPFITLAAYDAMRGAPAIGEHGEFWANRIPDPVRRIALAIEVFHKASLVHDDIEDDDAFRYGLPALHREHGVPMAINVGDYLIGVGYRLVAEQRAWLPSEAVADVLLRLSEAHTRLCEGQGAELAWRDGKHRRLPPEETLRIYALKTAPAFEAALFAGMRLAGPVEAPRETTARLARHIGVAFQILNDLDDWSEHQPNKRNSGGDTLGHRPTVLWAFALENLDPGGRRELEMLTSQAAEQPAEVVEAVRALYQRAGVFEQARSLVAKHRQRAREISDSLRPASLTQLLHYIADTALEG